MRRTPEMRMYRRRFTGPMLCFEVTQAMIDAHVLRGAPLPEGLRCIGARTNPERTKVEQVRLIADTCGGPVTADVGKWAVECVDGGWHLWAGGEFEQSFERYDAGSWRISHAGIRDALRGTAHGVDPMQGSFVHDMAHDLEHAHAHIAHLERELQKMRGEVRE